MAECVCNEIFDDGVNIIRADGQPTYRGRAAPGYDTNEAKWQVVKYFYSAADEVVKIIYAEGDAGFNHVYDERAGYTYTWTGA